jgi:hypothetical protein
MFRSFKTIVRRLDRSAYAARYQHIDKLDFLTASPQARADTFKTDTIKNSFAAASLVPFDPERVLSKLNIRLRTPTPPGSRLSSRSSIFTPNTRDCRRAS